MSTYIDKLERRDYLELYRLMYLARYTEDYMVELHQHTPITELPHVGTGQEAVSIGTCYHLRREDTVIPAHRSRGVFFAKGVSSRDMMAGAYGKDIPYTRGKNTSHHLGSPELGIVTGTGIIGAQIPLAAGVGLAFKLRRQDNVSVVYFGDGATNRGDFHEAVNLAGALSLPVVFVCENNFYAISTPLSAATKAGKLADRAVGYGISGVTVDGNDVLAVYEAMQEAVARARRGEGPTLLVCDTYRHRAHSERDFRDIRPPEEVAAWLKKDPLPRFRARILEEDRAAGAELDALEEAVRAEVHDAAEYALSLPYPPVDILCTNVYEESGGKGGAAL